MGVTAAPVPSIASSSSSGFRGIEVLSLSVRGEPAPKATGPVSREMAVWAKHAAAATSSAGASGRSLGLASGSEEKEADSEVEVEKLQAVRSRRESRHATWNHFAASPTGASPNSATRSMLPAVNGQPSARSSFVATYPSTASASSTMTVALTSMAGGESSPHRPLTSYSPLAGRNASSDLTPLFSSATTPESRSAGSALVHTTSDDLVKPSTQPGRRRSSLPLPASPSKPLSNITSPKRQPGQQSGASSPSSSSPCVVIGLHGGAVAWLVGLVAQ